MKQFSLLGVIAIFLVGGLTGCGGNGNAADPEGPAATTEQTVEETNAEEAQPASEFGVGPITEALNIPASIDAELAAQGKEIFEAKCTACHKLEEKYIGPALKGVTERRKPEWIMNMILAPEKMIQEDPTARQLAGETGAIMANQGLTKEQARAVLEYFRSIDNNASN